MDLFQAKETFSKMFPDKLKTFTFDSKCIRQIEIIFTEGNPHPRHHVEYQHVKVSVDGMSDQYIPIQPHRMIMSLKQVKDYVSSLSDVHINEHEIKPFKEMSEQDQIAHIKQWAETSGLTEEQIKGKFYASI